MRIHGVEVLNDPAQLQARMLAERAAGARIAFVPTMGYLHEGHVSLLRAGRERGDRLVLSIFVNPMQFGQSEDLSRYPRDLEGDLQKAASAGCDIAFCPTPETIYPPGFQTRVEVSEVQKGLCGDHRPGHFVGVATVVNFLAPLVTRMLPPVVTVGVGALAAAAIAVFYFARNFARRATLAVFGIVSKRLAEKLADTASKLADGLHFLGRGRDAGPFLLETGLYWLVNACGMWVLAWGCGIVHEGGSPITLGECFALMGMLGAAILIPGPPGMLGVFQVGIFCGMTLYFPEDIVKSNGAVFTFLLYVIQFAWTILAAVGCLFDREALASLKSSEDSAAVSVEAT